MKTMTARGLALALGLALASTVFADDKPAAHGHAAADGHGHKKSATAATHGVAVLQAMKDSGVKGELVFVQKGDVVHVTGKVSGLTPGLHGFHIHEFGDLRAADGTSAGPHYNPENAPHGGPESDHSHAGDLGNIEANADGVATVKKEIKGATLTMLLGRSVVVHADPDDLKSQPAGNAGPRIGVGVIGISAAPEKK